jgi:predicted amidohydrolase
MKVAVGQFYAGTDPAANREKLAKLAEQAAALGAELVVFPEAAMRFIGPPSDPLHLVAEPLDGPFISCLSGLAKRHHMVVVAGMFERVEDTSDVYNTIVAINTAGDIIGTYRKIHLFDALGVKESDRIKPGDGELLTFTFGDHTFGIMTCYDLRFPELARKLVDEGVNVFVVPSAWVHGILKEAHWSILARARAIENTCWVVGAAQVGGIFSGNSMIIDPMGVIVAALGEEGGVAAADLSAERTASVRAKLPCLANRRYRVEWAN